MAQQLFFFSLSIALLTVIASIVLFVKAYFEDKKFIIKETPLRISKEVDFKLSLKY